MLETWNTVAIRIYYFGGMFLGEASRITCRM